VKLKGISYFGMSKDEQDAMRVLNRYMDKRLRIRRMICIPLAVLLFIVILLGYMAAIWFESGKLGGTASVLIAPLVVFILAAIDWSDW
jgi:F0F1-type ATP synthase assembly protein I